jgi:hypothetical protein
MMSNISVTEYLNYEGGKFSKSRGTGAALCLARWFFFLKDQGSGVAVILKSLKEQDDVVVRAVQWHRHSDLVSTEISERAGRCRFQGCAMTPS